MTTEEPLCMTCGFGLADHRDDDHQFQQCSRPVTVTTQRAHWLGAPEFFHLNLLCRAVVEALDCSAVYLVGSSLVRRDFRDVDIRAVLQDEEFDRLFPEVAGKTEGSWAHCAMWSFMCGAFSEWLAKRSGLPIDFQIQRMTQANKEYQGPRNALGVFLGRRAE